MPVRPTSQKSTTPEDYRILDLEPGATREDAKRAYRRLAKQWHPDRFHNFPEYERIEAENRFKREIDADKQGNPEAQAYDYAGGEFAWQLTHFSRHILGKYVLLR